MPRKILVEFTFDWEDYDDVDDEFLMEEAFTINPLTSLEGGISAKIIQQPSSSGVESAGVKQLLEDFLDYVGGNFTQHGTGYNVYWDRGEGEDRQMNYEGVVEDYLFDYSEFADAVLSSTKSVSAVESAGVWVNCNVRLPNIEDHFDDPPKYILKCGNDGWRGDRDVYYQDAASIREICKNYDYCEWLDESQSAGSSSLKERELTNQLINLNNAIDAYWNAEPGQRNGKEREICLQQQKSLKLLESLNKKP